MEEQADNIVPEGSLAYQARTARFCGGPVSATPAPGTAPRHVYAQSRADYQQPQWPVLPKRLDMMCVASGSALSIATFGLFPLAGLDVSPVANKPAAQSQVSILKVCHDRHTGPCSAQGQRLVTPSTHVSCQVSKCLCGSVHVYHSIRYANAWKCFCFVTMVLSR